MTKSPSEIARRAYRAEDWAARLFLAMGYSVDRNVLVAGFQLDMIVRKEELSHPVEIKYRIRPLGMNDIAEAALRLRGVGQDGALVAPILMVFGTLSRSARYWAQGEYAIRLWDIDSLREKAKPYPQLARELEDIAGDVTAPAASNPARESEGARLIAQLEAHLAQNTLSPAGYEALCQEVFVYLFDPDLYGFERQAETSDGGNRYDFICRIRPGNPFWDAIRHDFRTRAILFECKNYEQPIGPDQIYSTERYLFSGALRTVCLLISRLPPSDGAVRAAQGAMREASKMILLLSNADLVAMIRLKDTPDGPESYLDERIWNFIISLPR